MKSKIPLVDLTSQYNSIKLEIDEAIKKVISDCGFVGGLNNKFVNEFENSFADYLNILHCVSCGNGTDAIEITLKAFGIGPGDEVIVPALSWFSTSEAIGNVGAKPVFVDVDPEYYTIDATKIDEKISTRTKAIMPVHLYGQPADMDEIMELAKQYDLKVIEDCAQAHGAKYKSKMVGTIGDAAIFSFFPGKNLGAYGDAGGIVTNSDEIAETCRMIANHGQLKKHIHLIEGRNSRMDGLQAAILTVKLKFLEEWTQKRIAIANDYNRFLCTMPLQLPKNKDQTRHVFHLYVIQTDKRNELMKVLKNNNIETAIHYPRALPFLDVYANNNYTRCQFPVSATITGLILSLPIFAELSSEKIEIISNCIKTVIKD